MIEIAYQTDIGTQRKDNQDQVGAFYNQQNLPLVMVADGVASNAGSRLASQMAIEKLGEAWQDSSLDDDEAIENWIYDQVDWVNQLVLRAAESGQPSESQMATTLVLGVVTGQRLLVANVGDSKAYIWRDGQLQQVSFDHTLKNELARQNGQHYDDDLPNANSLTRYLGVDDRVNLEMHWYPFLPADILFLTSDGLPKALSLTEMSEIIGQKRPLPELVKALINAANQHAASDNVTALLLKQ
ncbi:protein phosphatase 2C domain-containing protein [Lactobacillaceae bacterium L1_55_11]|nr:protein phosphatase 2C domain-containing protein [Lactobacillaceae bacterium L1_55_11]